MILGRCFLSLLILVSSLDLVEASNGQRIRSVKKVANRRYMFECATSYEEPRLPLTVHAEYFKQCNTARNLGPLCRLELNDGKNSQLEKYISDFQKDIRVGKVEARKISQCPETLGATREIMDSNGCTAKVSICYPAKYVQNGNSKTLKSQRMPASLPNPKPKRSPVNF